MTSPASMSCTNVSRRQSPTGVSDGLQALKLSFLPSDKAEIMLFQSIYVGSRYVKYIANDDDVCDV